jgi:hypothetical protein
VSLPAEVAMITGRFLELIDARAAGLVTGLYLRGSLVFGEYFRGQSDIGPRWQPIVREAVRARERPDDPSEYADDADSRGRDTTEFTWMAIESGLALRP